MEEELLLQAGDPVCTVLSGHDIGSRSVGPFYHELHPASISSPQGLSTSHRHLHTARSNWHNAL